MSLNHWKLINHLKVYFSKHSQEKGVLDLVNKEWLSIFEKLPLFYSRALTGGDVDGPSYQRQQQGDAAVEPKPTRVPSVGLAPAKDDHSHGLLDVSKSKTVKPAEEKTPDSPQSKWLPKQSVSKGNNYAKFYHACLTFEAVLGGVSAVRQMEGVRMLLQESIYSRTKHVVTSVMTAQSEQSRLKRMEELTNHLLQYPEAKSLAVREGVVRTLLHIRRQNADADTLAVVREACTLLGHVDPLPARGIRILSIDGGGIRGVIVIELLKKLERLTGKRVYEMFDFICGVSTGAILLSVLVLQKKSLEEMSQLYKELSTKVFTQNAIWGTSNLMWSHSYYNTEMWESMLRQNIGDVALIKTARDPQCPKLSFVSAVVNQAQLSAFVFRNYSFPPKSRSRYAGSCKYEVWQAVRASAAAPSYFEEFQLDGFLHQDGGILVNNPCGVALHEATHLWPGSPIQCVVSIGTGRLQSVPTLSEKPSVGMSSWRTKFMKILDSATDTEVVHTVMSDLLPSSVYFRFNPHLAEIISMVEIDPAKIRQLELEAAMYYRRNEETFEEVARALTAPPSLSQRTHRWLEELWARLA